MWSHHQPQGGMKDHQSQQCHLESKKKSVDLLAERNLRENPRRLRRRRPRRGEDAHIDQTDREGPQVSTGLTEIAPVSESHGRKVQRHLLTRLVKGQKRPLWHSLQLALQHASATGHTWLVAGT